MDRGQEKTDALQFVNNIMVSMDTHCRLSENIEQTHCLDLLKRLKCK
jgi:hypothetical protein